MRCFTILGVLGLIMISCGGSDDPPPTPGTVQLIFPEENSECTTGVSVNEELSQVTFEWQASENTESYTLRAINLNTNTPQTITTASTSASISINKGTPYSWSVSSTNSQSNETSISETWLFYNAGSQTTYAPFPAQLQSPASGSTISPNASNEVVLDWLGADVENDIEGYQVFFSNQNPPTTELGAFDAFTSSVSASVSANTVYFWRVITRDAEGNTSDSGVFEFKTL
ncbi:hypothetical protein ACOKFD_14650 [Flagellimonas sp. S174]|uniref:hypothetical protein n=1 Tax=Flagellimonas sp. S174 TaxID=3410790 RepID=UPI003BF5E618